MQGYGAGTDVGKVRNNNEDSFVCDTDECLWIIADGMGGLGLGEVASAMSTYTITNLVKSGHGVNQAIEQAHQRIKDYSATEDIDMGTTVVALLSRGAIYNVFWVGDSRAYLFDQKLEQITVDHSLVQSLIEKGELTKEKAETDPRKNAITRALGVREFETVRADSVSDVWRPGQKILLCSDGLSDCVSNQTIEYILHGAGSDQDKVEKLIESALEQGGVDNITVVLVSAPLVASKPDAETIQSANRNTTVS